MKRHLALVLAGCALTACGPKTPLALDLRTVAVSVPRIITPAVALVPPALVPRPAALPPLPPAPALRLPPPPPAGSPAPAPTLHPVAATAPANPCPTAPAFATPAKPLAPGLSGAPSAASTTEVSSGTYSAAARGSLNGTAYGMITRLPSSVSSAGQKIDSWRVQRLSPAGIEVETYRLLYPSSSALASSAGIYLAGLAWKDPVRGDLSFQASGNGLWVLPDPVQLSSSGGVQYVGTDTDASTLTTLTLTRNVTGRKRVDLCGQVVDTYTVEMTGTLTNGKSQRQVNWTQQLATAYGGVDVAQTLTLSEPAGGFLWTRSLRGTSLPKEAS